MMNQAKKILLVQLYSNGDCLYATTIARQIKEDFPGAHLSWMIASFCKGILQNNPYVDEIIDTSEVAKNDVNAFRKLRKKILKDKADGKWDEVFITHNMDKNLALYDGTIRGMIFRAYPFPVKVPVQPVLVLSEQEKNKVQAFADAHRLEHYSNVILWEYAPQSGQSQLSFEFVTSVAERITKTEGTLVILSSAKAFRSTDRIIDASGLSVRENAALTHYCSLLIGCSSGITWINTSSAARQLPMVQLLDPGAYFMNAPSTDFKRYGISTAQLIQLCNYDENKIVDLIGMISSKGFNEARAQFNQSLPLQFNTTRKIVYNLLCYLQFGAVRKHYQVMTSVYGKHPAFLKQFWWGIIGFPFKLIANKWKKWVLKAGPGK